MKRILLFLMSVLLSVCLVAGQQKGPAVSQKASRNDVLRLFRNMQLKKQMESMQQTMIAQMEPILERTMTEQSRNLSPEQRAKLQSLLKSEMSDVVTMYPVSEMLDDMVPVYQRHFTEADIAGISAFYSSPAGQDLLNKTPEIMKDSMTTIMPKMQQRMQLSMKRTQQRVDEMFKTPPPNKPADTKK